MLLTSLLLALLGQADGPCTLSGTAQLRVDGAPGDPSHLVVYVRSVGPQGSKPARPSSTARPQQTIRQLHKAFLPAVLVVEEEDTVQFTNEDKEDHQVFSNSTAAPFILDASKGLVTGSRVFARAGTVALRCNIHPWMRAAVLVVKNRFHTEVAADGSWRIPGLPSQDFTVVLWEPNGNETEVEVKQCGPVPPLQVNQKALPKAVRYDGSRYPYEYGQWKR